MDNSGLGEAKRVWKVGIIGFGERILADYHSVLTRSSFDVVAVCDINEDRRSHALHLFPEARLYPDYEILVESECEALDFVLVTTPPRYFHPIAKAAINAGIDVLVEFPGAMNADESEELVQEAQRLGRIISPADHWSELSYPVLFENALQSGLLGEWRTLVFNHFSQSVPKGHSDWRPDWRTSTRWAVGGVGFDVGLAFVSRLLDWKKGVPRELCAHSRPLPNGEVDGELAMCLHYEPFTAYLTMGWGCGFDRQFVAVSGERGSAVIDEKSLQISPNENLSQNDRAKFEESRLSDGLRPRKPLANQSAEKSLYHFLEVLQSRDISQSRSAQLCKALSLMELAYESAAAKGKVIDVTVGILGAELAQPAPARVTEAAPASKN